MATLFRLACVAVVWLSTIAAVWAAESLFDIRNYGAQPDGKTVCTQAIQKAVDAAAAAGGGTVYLPPGTWLSGTIFLKSHVTLRLEAGCTLLGSGEPADYPAALPKLRSYTDNYVRQGLISGEDLENVTICGRGTIDGQGGKFRWREYKNRPYVIRLVGCRDVLVEDVRLQNSPMWMQQYLGCQRVTVRNISVENHASYNNDGLDIDSCRDVSISGCTIDSDDDALCLKSTSAAACENVTISNCTLRSHCNALKMGTESNGGFRNITITNCAISAPRGSKAIYGAAQGLAGLALEIVDGGELSRVAISNVTIDGVTTPIFIRLGNRGRPPQADSPKPPAGRLHHVVLSNITATGGSKIACSITGIPGHCVEDVSLSNIQLGCVGGGTAAETTRQVPEREDSYPECKMFGTLPAYGFYCRHVRGLRLRDVVLQTAEPDLRHAIVCDDVEDVVIDGLEARPSPGALPVVRLDGTRGALIRGCRLRSPAETFLQLRGAGTRKIALLGNDLSPAGRAAALGAEVSADALRKRNDE